MEALAEGIEMSLEATTPLLEEAGSGIAASSTSAAMQGSEAAAVSAARTSAASEATAAAKSIMPETVEGGTSDAAIRTTNYNSGPPISWAGSTPKIILAGAASAFGGVGLSYTLKTADQGKRALADFTHDVGEGAKKLSEDLEHGVKDTIANAALARDHLSHAVGDAAGAIMGGPVKTIAEISVSVIVAGGILYVTYKGYMFLKGSK